MKSDAKTWKLEAALRASGQMLYEHDIENGKISFQGNTQLFLGAADDSSCTMDLPAWHEVILPAERAELIRELNLAQAEQSSYSVSYWIFSGGRMMKVLDRGAFL